MAIVASQLLKDSINANIVDFMKLKQNVILIIANGLDLNALGKGLKMLKVFMNVKTICLIMDSTFRHNNV